MRGGGWGESPSLAQKSRELPHPDAEFVFSVLVRESKASAVGDDDKVYYFFTERAAEEGSGSFAQSRSSHRVARVARVCKVSSLRLGQRCRG